MGNFGPKSLANLEAAYIVIRLPEAGFGSQYDDNLLDCVAKIIGYAGCLRSAAAAC